MPSDLLARYEADPLALDEEVRRRFGIPEDRYYSVAIYPPELAGRITIERSRAVKSVKISKSNP